MKNELIEKLLLRADEDLTFAKESIERYQGYLDNPNFAWGRDYTKPEVERKIEGCKKDIEELSLTVEMLNDLREYYSIGAVEEFKSFKEKERERTPLYPKDIDGYKLYGTCPTCGTSISTSSNSERCRCGQKLNWLNCEV